MNSLQELNNWGSTPVDYLDDRPSAVVFDRQPPLTAVDQTFNAYSALAVFPTPGIEIVDIINYQTANVRYRVTIKNGGSPAFTGSTITFGTFNSGVTLTQAGNVYTVSGIHSVSDWNSAKNFTWSLPFNFASYPLWYLECTIIYYSSALARDVEMTWEIVDDRFYHVAELNSVASVSSIVGVIKPLSSAISSVASVYANVVANKIVIVSSIQSETTLVCDGYVNVDYLNSSSSMIINATNTVNPGALLDCQATIIIDAVASAVNLDPRSYLANKGNAIFATNTPQVDSLNSADTFSIVLSSSLGTFAANSTTVPTSTLTISGTKSVVNAAMSNVHFYPTVGSSASGVFSWQQSRNSTVEFTRNITLTGSANNFVSVVYTFLGDDIWTPTIDEYIYSTMDVLAVGGGGGGSAGKPRLGGRGGAGGRVIEAFNLAISNSPYYIDIGLGGLGAITGEGAPGNGGTETTLNIGIPSNPPMVNVITAPAGLGGDGGNDNTVLRINKQGGDCPAGSINGVPSGTTRFGWGGYAQTSGEYDYRDVCGGGASSNFGGPGTWVSGPRDAYYNQNGGDGVLSSISGSAKYYGGGGGGAVLAVFGDPIPQGIGGLGGGGNGALQLNQKNRTAGQANTGGGGGGGAGTDFNTYSGQFGNNIQIATGANGGSGILIIRCHG
jgi:hypothetical protein